MPAGRTEPRRPHVLCLAGLDPSGGAGLQVDIETVRSLGGHAMSIATCLTVQDHHDLRRVEPVGAALVTEQVECLLANTSIHAIKIGALCDTTVVEAIAALLPKIAGIPVVLDPVLAAGGGTRFCDDRTMRTISDALLPLVSLVTPNANEVQQLASSAPTEADDASAAAATLSQQMPGRVLLTDCSEPAASPACVDSELWHDGHCLRRWQTERRAARYRGTGCMLSTAIATELAQGADLESAVTAAQAFVADAIDASVEVADGLRIPVRHDQEKTC